MRMSHRLLLGLAAAACVGTAQAAVLASLAPFPGHAFGQQSDANAMPPYSQVFSAPAGSMLESISWWGYHGPNSMGPAYDNFVVALDGVAVSGSLSVDNSHAAVSGYTLMIGPMALSATTLSVLNDSPDVEWFWQSAVSTGSGPHATDVAFSLQGNVVSVPEPATYAQMLVGLIGLTGLIAVQRQRRS